MGRTAVGVRGIRLREGDYVVGAARAKADHEVLSITEKGLSLIHISSPTATVCASSSI